MTTIARSGKARFIRSTSPWSSGGISRFCFGLSPSSQALRAWIATRRTPVAARVSRKAGSTASGSCSSTPIRHFTVTGTGPAASIIAATQSATSSGVRISAAPKHPDCTRSDGQPTLRSISSKPKSRPTRAASASATGSAPPSCSASGRSPGRNPSSRSRSPRTTAAAVTISV